MIEIRIRHTLATSKDAQFATLAMAYDQQWLLKPPTNQLKQTSRERVRDEMTYETHGLDTQQTVFFYEHDFYCLSNFSAFTLMWKNIRFDTSESAYHYEKFPGNPIIQHAIRTASSAHEAYKLAERNQSGRRKDWDDVKVSIMLDILREKVSQHEYVRRKLLATGDRTLVEDSWRDSFWGWGKHIDGQNMLGRLWMQVRDELRNGAEATETFHQPTEANEQRKG